jgi:hypothetical protein
VQTFPQEFIVGVSKHSRGGVCCLHLQNVFDLDTSVDYFTFDTYVNPARGSGGAL